MQEDAGPLPGSHKTAIEAEAGCRGKIVVEGHGLEEEERERGLPTEFLPLFNSTKAEEPMKHLSTFPMVNSKVSQDPRNEEGAPYRESDKRMT